MKRWIVQDSSFECDERTTAQKAGQKSVWRWQSLATCPDAKTSNRHESIHLPELSTDLRNFLTHNVQRRLFPKGSHWPGLTFAQTETVQALKTSSLMSRHPAGNERQASVSTTLSGLWQRWRDRRISLHRALKSATWSWSSSRVHAAIQACWLNYCTLRELQSANNTPSQTLTDEQCVWHSKLIRTQCQQLHVVTDRLFMQQRLKQCFFWTTIFFLSKGVRVKNSVAQCHISLWRTSVRLHLMFEEHIQMQLSLRGWLLAIFLGCRWSNRHIRRIFPNWLWFHCEPVWYLRHQQQQKKREQKADKERCNPSKWARKQLFAGELIGQKAMSVVWVIPSRSVRTTRSSHSSQSTYQEQNLTEDGISNAARARNLSLTVNNKLREKKRLTPEQNARGSKRGL